MKSKTFELVSIIIGTFLGAGFISGKEVAVYFAKYGFLSICFSIISGILFYIFVKMCLQIGKKLGDGNNNLRSIFGKIFPIVNFLILINCFIGIGAMIAGAGSVGDVLDISILKIILPIICVIGCIILLQFKYTGFTKINILIVPVIIFLLIAIPLISCFNSDGLTIAVTNVFRMFLGGVVDSILYIFFNMLSLGVLLIQVGAKYKDKEISRASIISSIIIVSLIIVMCLSMIFTDSSVIYSDMPLLQEARNISVICSYVYAICQFLGIFTTLVSSTYVTINILSDKMSNNSAIFLSLFLGILISFLGFANIVNYLYKLNAFISIIFFILLFYKLYLPKNNFKIQISKKTST